MKNKRLSALKAWKTRRANLKLKARKSAKPKSTKRKTIYQTMQERFIRLGFDHKRTLRELSGKAARNVEYAINELTMLAKDHNAQIQKFDDKTALRIEKTFDAKIDLLNAYIDQELDNARSKEEKKSEKSRKALRKTSPRRTKRK